MPGKMPDQICVMFEHRSREYWISNSEYDPHELHGFGGPSRYVKTFDYSAEPILITFDEPALIAHIKKWGKRIVKKHGMYGPGDPEIHTQWLSYQKLLFKQLGGIRMLANQDPTEIVLEEKQA